MKDLLLVIVKALVNEPDKIKVKEIKGTGSGVILQIAAVKDDYRFIIGKKGRIIGAIRSIIGAASFRTKTKCLIEVLDDTKLRKE